MAHEQDLVERVVERGPLRGVGAVGVGVLRRRCWPSAALHFVRGVGVVVLFEQPLDLDLHLHLDLHPDLHLHKQVAAHMVTR